MPQAPAVHVGVPFGTLGHTLLQLWQLFGSVCSLTHVFPHWVYPMLQCQLHAEPEHWVVEFAGPAGHTSPQPLQFCASLVVLTHVSVLGQSVGVLPEQPLTQAVPLHTGVPPEHVTPHPPQLGDVAVLVSHPLSGPPVQ
jgi:hypothetical protein